jgi:lipopolysaccharide export system protein LptA
MRRLPIPALLTALLAACALWVSPAWAAKTMEPASSDQPIHVVSDSLEVDNKTQVAIFIGAVKATQGDVTIVSDKLEVYYDKDAKDQPKKEAGEGTPGIMDGGGKVRKVVALGHVKITQKDRVAVGRKATYWAGGRKMLLEGKSTVWRGKNQVSGEKITVFLDQDRALVHGAPGKRVAVTIQPKKQGE